MADQKTITLPADKYAEHNQRRKMMGLTWAEYIDGQAPELKKTLRRVIREELGTADGSAEDEDPLGRLYDAVDETPGIDWIDASMGPDGRHYISIVGREAPTDHTEEGEPVAAVFEDGDGTYRAMAGAGDVMGYMADEKLSEGHSLQEAVEIAAEFVRD